MSDSPFEHMVLNMEEENTLRLYRARIVSKPDVNDDRLQVRVIPHMLRIEETELLPKWPPFYKGQVIVGRSEQEVEAAGDPRIKPEYVWVAALPDFTLGFVLGLANSFFTEEVFPDSYNYTDIIAGLKLSGAVSQDIDYKNVMVQFWNEDYIEMVNTKTGEKYIVNSSGTMVTITRNQVYVQVGARNSTNEQDKNKWSGLRVTRGEIGITTDHLRIRANRITLGDSNLNLLATSATSAVTTAGIDLQPLTKVKF